MNLVFAVLLGESAHAGWIKDFCEKRLVVEDIYPYAEFSTRYLVEVIHDPEVRRELEFRYKTGMLDELEKHLVRLRLEEK